MSCSLTILEIFLSLSLHTYFLCYLFIYQSSFSKLGVFFYSLNILKEKKLFFLLLGFELVSKSYTKPPTPVITSSLCFLFFASSLLFPSHSLSQFSLPYISFPFSPPPKVKFIFIVSKTSEIFRSRLRFSVFSSLFFLLLLLLLCLLPSALLFESSRYTKVYFGSFQR
jgi:hypothetical protein